MHTIVVGTRQSKLALTQTNQVVDKLGKVCSEQSLEFDFQVKKFVTKGDRILDVTLSKVGGKGLFVKEIEQALLEGTIDFAVHSLKDVPSVLPKGLKIAFCTERVDARDCLISKKGRKLEQLPKGARVGTSSLRRACQLKYYRPDLQIESIRGNIDTRIRKLEEMDLDAVVLAAAGLLRMGWEDRIDEYLPVEICLPAVGQGALAIEYREEHADMERLLHLLNHPATALAVASERSFLARLEGGCQVPIGAYASLPDKDGDLISLMGIVGSPDGKELLKDIQTGQDPLQLGRQVAEHLISKGADRLLAQFRE